MSLTNPKEERYQLYLDRLKQAASHSAPALILHIGASPAEWWEVLRAGDFSVQVFNNEKANSLDQLRQAANSIVSAVTCFHVVEHLSFSELVHLLDETLRVLQPDGVAVFETVHPLGTATSGCTPVHPIFPETLIGVGRLRGFHTSECLVFDHVMTWIGGKG